jgi:2-C-methyl-D-erythritol 4-phosphate cytidylyltransferase
VLVKSDATNFKVTRALDLQLAQWVLNNRKTPA